jgi:hypothetical protein
MSEMIERVARAIEEASVVDWLAQPDYALKMRNCAIAAIKAMREPTEDMVEGSFLLQEPEHCEERKAIYQAMIDEALK